MDSKRDDIMINESEEDQSGSPQSPSRGLGKKMIILLGGLVLLLGIGGYFGYTLFFQEKGPGAKAGHKENKEPEKVAIIALDPFILNLSDPGRHLKVAVQLELKNAKDEVQVKERTPKLRDIIIMLLTSKSVDSVSSPEGKFQLKDEILLRANQAMGKELFRNVYFTDFVMQ
jgi:flagellar protein FliL